ncbi:hypothetical protein DPMN_001042 [Dreissena polymorpha]|uniref:Uncharacterized protein n=1 Tax=Dreissena polymorpha TaxID=45954 RepID=A0A9D4RSF8_DREPO|nr:hypothetical protein DPMN_001042 [Dreissena polymorpha]
MQRVKEKIPSQCDAVHLTYNPYIIGTNFLTKFHADRKINVASRVLTRKNAPPPGSHVFQPTGIIFELIQDIIGMNLLTKFHEDRTVNVASRVLTRFYYGHIRNKNIMTANLIKRNGNKSVTEGRKYGSKEGTSNWQLYAPRKFSGSIKMPRPLEAIFFKQTLLFSNSSKDIIETNLLTKFHEDWTINVASSEKNAPPLVAMTNLLTKFHDDRKVNVTSRVLTRKIAPPLWWPHIIGMNLLTEKNAPPLGSHVFQAKVTIFELIQDIIKTNLLTIFHQDWTIKVASRVLTRKNAPPPGGHVFQPIGIIFELVQDIIRMNLLTKKNAPSLGSHVFQAKVTIFELIKDISGTNCLSKFHEDRKINVASRVLTRFYYSHISKNVPHPGGHVFQPTGIIFELVQDIIGMNLLTKFHEDQTINVASRVLTRFYYSHIRKNAPPLGSHVFQANVTIFELIQDIIETNLLTKFHEDWTINVASRE